MSLDWSIEDVRDYKEIAPTTKNGIEGEKTHSLIWATLSVGIGVLNESTLDEFWMRLSAIEQRDGSYMRKYVTDESGEVLVDVPFKREDLVRRIGLRTNVSNITHTKWLKHFKKTGEKR